MIAITGAAGFIGSHLAHRLHRHGYELCLVDRAADKSFHLLGLERHPFLRHDEFADRFEAASLAVDAVFHLGACSSTTESDWDYLRRNNVEYSQRLWRRCAQTGRPFVYASSAATYGDGSRGFDDRTSPTNLVPLNLYGKSKNDFDAWALQQIERHDAAPPTWAGVKFFNVFGPRETRKGRMASVVWQAYRQICDSGRVRLFRSTHPEFPDGGQCRDFVFVEDCVDHLLWLWQRGCSGIFNSGTGRPRTFFDLAQSVFAAIGITPRIEFIDMPADLAGKYQNHTCAAMQKLRATGYTQTPTPLEAGAVECVRFWNAMQATGGDRARAA